MTGASTCGAERHEQKYVGEENKLFGQSTLRKADEDKDRKWEIRFC